MRGNENHRDGHVLQVCAAPEELSHRVDNTDRHGEFLFACSLLGGGKGLGLDQPKQISHCIPVTTERPSPGDTRGLSASM